MPAAEICPCCGQPIAPTIHLVGVQRAIYTVIRNNPGISTGGISRWFAHPITENNIRQHIFHINEKLHRHGLKIVRNRITKIR